VIEVDERTAERLMREGKIENFAVVDGKVEVKRTMAEEPGESWPEANKRSK
jgi:hypothetical protein